MYNDYYLQQILSELGQLEDITDNQETIIQQQQTLISGDIEINNKLQDITSVNITILIVSMLTLIYSFITKCWKC